MTFDVFPKCGLCGGAAVLLYRGNADARQFFTEKRPYRIAEGGGQEKLDVYECVQCGAGFSPQNLTPGELAGFYESQPADENYLSQEIGRRKAFRRILTRVEKMCPAKGKIFDLGAGPGFFLDEARKSGWEIYGSEASTWGRRYAKEKSGINLYTLNGLNEFPDHFFEVITILDVIEHVAHPADLLRLINAKLKPGGILVITTPRFESITRKILGQRWYFMFPAHLWYFTRKSLDKLLSDAGFRGAVYKYHVFHFSVGYIVERILALAGIQKKFNSGILSKIVIPFCLGEEWQIYVPKSKG